MNKINLIFTCLILLIAVIGCASAAAVPSNSSDLSSANQIEHLSIQLQADTEIGSSEIAYGGVESVSGSNLEHSRSMEDKKLGNNILPNVPTIPFSDAGFKNKTSETEVNNAVSASFSDLNNDIKSISSGSTFNLNRDYVYSDKDSAYKSGIVIDMDNITINGNGHCIDGNKSASIFKVTGCDVHLTNLIFANAKCMSTEGSGEITQTQSLSGLIWLGNNGVLSDSIFRGNTALHGGAITWMGNNGLINNITALDNLALGVGGAIYIGGKNNTISNSTFSNSSSILAGESIYFNRNRENSNISKCNFTSSIPFVDGKLSNIDVDYLKYSFNTLVSDKTINLMNALYRSIIYNSVVDCGDGIFASSFYNNATEDFTLSFYRSFTGGFAFKKIFHFSKIKESDDVFKALLHHGFSIELTLIKRINVTNINDYAYACNYNRDNLYDEPDLVYIIEDFWNNPADKIAYALDVKFTKAISIESNLAWDTSKKRLDVISINGCGSNIHINNDEKAEFKWAILAPACVFTVNNLTIQGFNNAIVNNGGYGLLYNTRLDGNRMDYAICMDWGAGIQNAGYILCSNCTFSNNYAKNGGAIFNQGFLELNNCSFENNIGYGDGNNVFSAGDASVWIDKEKIENSTDLVTFHKGWTASERLALKVSAYVISFAVGFALGFFLANPALGMLAGAVAGGAIGSYFAAETIRYTYDINFNRFSTALELISGCVLLGMIGGGIGGSFSPWYTASETNTINIISNEEIVSDKGVVKGLYDVSHYVEEFAIDPLK